MEEPKHQQAHDAAEDGASAVWRQTLRWDTSHSGAMLEYKDPG